MVQLLPLRAATVIGIASVANRDWLAAHGLIPGYVRLAVNSAGPSERIEPIIASDARPSSA